MAPTDVRVLWNASIIDVRNRRPQYRMCIWVRDGIIDEVREASEPALPDGAIDLHGRFVMPGLIDAHIHLLDDPAMLGDLAAPTPLKGEEPRARELVYFVLANAARAFLRFGITTIRDVGCHDDNAIVLREAIRLGLTEGPRVLACGRILSATAPGGRLFHSMYEEADGPWEMRRCVRNQLRRGADYIKVMAGGARSVLRENPEPAQLTREEMDAVVDESHRLGLRVAAHAEGLGAVRSAVEAGVDTVEHGLSLHRDPLLLEQMARRGTVLVPTLSTFHDVGERFAERWQPSLVQQAKRQQEEAHLTLNAAREAGVTLAMGFDSGPPGADALELVRMVEGGLTPHEGIAAATAGSASALGLLDVGTIEPGRTADLVVLNGDPLEDVARLTRAEEFWIVVREGRVVAGQALENGDLLGMPPRSPGIGQPARTVTP
ncbi:MAG: amidohydrolase family protein [Candidatus Dormibacteraeota bacterium]|nr:amidohydrolase family protein [Candidatus Dormibacteraeota bacterium]